LDLTGDVRALKGVAADPVAAATANVATTAIVIAPIPWNRLFAAVVIR